MLAVTPYLFTKFGPHFWGVRCWRFGRNPCMTSLELLRLVVHGRSMFFC